MASLFRKSYGPLLHIKIIKIHYTILQYSTNKAQHNLEKQRLQEREQNTTDRTEKYELTISLRISTCVFRRNSLVNHWELRVRSQRNPQPKRIYDLLWKIKVEEKKKNVRGGASALKTGSVQRKCGGGTLEMKTSHEDI